LESSSTQLLFEAKDLKFQLGEIEPFFCTLALYDLKSKKKLTEDFQFDVNTANTSALIQHVLVSNRQPNIYLHIIKWW